MDGESFETETEPSKTDQIDQVKEYKDCCTDDSPSPETPTYENDGNEEGEEEMMHNEGRSQEKGTEADAEGGPSDAQSELENPQSVQLEEFEAEAACPEEHVPGINEGGKDQKFSSEPEKASGKTYKIFVSNLPPGLCSSELQELFEPYGKVAECEIFAKNYAFVHMISEENGIKAMAELNEFDLRGCKINVKKSVHAGKPLEVKKEVVLEVETFKIFIGNLKCDVSKEYVVNLVEPFGRTVEVETFNTKAFVHMETEEGGMKAIENLNGTMLPDAEQEKPLVVAVSKNHEGPSLSTMKMNVKNVPPTLTADALRSLFTPYGLVLKAKIFHKPLVSHDGTREGVVFLEQFGNIRSAIRDLNGKEIEGCKLLVEPCFNNTDKKTDDSDSHKNISDIYHSQVNHNHRPLPRPRQFFNNKNNPGWQRQSGSQSRHNNAHALPYHDPSPLMRLIPMPSKEELQSCPRLGAGRGRLLMRNTHAPPPLMEQEIYPYFPEQGGYNEFHIDDTAEEYGNDFSGFDAQGTNPWACGNDTESFQPPPTKIRRNVEWNSSTVEGGGNFSNHSKDSWGAQQNQPTNNLFPNFPPSTDFPKVPQSLMSLQLASADEQDWSSDVSLTNFSEFSSVGSTPNTLNAVPFDYTQMNNRKKHTPYNNHRSQFNHPNAERNYKRGKGQSTGKTKKGRARHPGLGTSQQQKKAAQQQVEPDGSGINVTSSATATSGSNKEESNQAGPSDNSAFAPYYFQQNWSFKKSHNNRHRKPSAKELKDAEEEQKRQYSDYLKQKPWLYQAIPGTVKKVDK